MMALARMAAATALAAVLDVMTPTSTMGTANGAVMAPVLVVAGAMVPELALVGVMALVLVVAPFQGDRTTLKGASAPAVTFVMALARMAVATALVAAGAAIGAKTKGVLQAPYLLSWGTFKNTSW